MFSLYRKEKLLVLIAVLPTYQILKQASTMQRKTAHYRLYQSRMWREDSYFLRASNLHKIHKAAHSGSRAALALQIVSEAQQATSTLMR